MNTVPARLWLVGAVALLAVTAAGCSSGSASSSTSSSTAGTIASSGTRGAVGQHSGSSTSTSNGTSGGSTQPKSSAGSGSTGAGGSGSTGAGGSGSSGSGPKSGSNGTVPSLSDQFNADATSFKSAASSAQQSVGQLPSNASAQQVAPKVAPLMAAATTFQSQLVSLQWPTAAESGAQSLNENLGKLTAVIQEAERSEGFGSAPQFRSQFSSAISAVNATLSSVSAQVG
jgi:hypothetical protein